MMKSDNTTMQDAFCGQFALLLRYHRKERKITQQELSDVTGISRSQIAALETCIIRPSRSRIADLADGLQLTPFDRARLFVAAGYIEQPLDWLTMQAVAQALALGMSKLDTDEDGKAYPDDTDS